MTNPFGPSWKTAVIGFVAAVTNYLAGLGPNLPSDSKGWQTVFISAALFALGAAAKDANVSNSSHPMAVAQPVVPVVTATPTSPAGGPPTMAVPPTEPGA